MYLVTLAYMAAGILFTFRWLLSHRTLLVSWGESWNLKRIEIIPLEPEQRSYLRREASSIAMFDPVRGTNNVKTDRFILSSETLATNRNSTAVGI